MTGWLSALCSALALALLAHGASAQNGLADNAEVASADATSADTENLLASLLTVPNAEQDYEPAPAVWLLSDQDTMIYMFGTIHALPPGFAWRSAEFDRIVAEVDELVLETSDADAERELAEALPGMVDAIFARTPTSQLMSPENGKKWLKLGRMTGIETREHDSMPLILSMMGVGLTMAMMEGSLDEFGVETVLSAEFSGLGKPIGSIENSAGVMTALLAIDEAILVSALEEDLSAWDGRSLDSLVLSASSGEEAIHDVDAGIFAMEHAWARGEVSEAEMFDESPIGAALSKVLIEDRNREWAEWLDKRLDQPGNILLAVGAGHFEGRHSVVRMLEDRGLEVRRIR